MAYELYVSDYSHLKPCEFRSSNNLNIKCERLSPKFCGWRKYIQWKIATLGKVKVYVVYDDEKIVHCSYAVWGKDKFRFLGKTDIEIGPCWTHLNYRGQGIYPAILSHIIQKELLDGGHAYMIIHDSNEASRRGVTKAGFQQIMVVLKRDVLRRYCIIE